MIEINLKGGLGNQMFEYSVARCLSLKYKTGLALNTWYFLHTAKDDTPRQYQLNIFNVDKEAKIKETINPIIRFTQRLILRFLDEEMVYKISRFFLRFSLPVYLNNYFQSEKYFKDIRDILLKEFTLVVDIGPEAQKIKKTLENSAGICLNVRRGDYLKPGNAEVYNVCDKEYYRQAMTYIKNNVRDPLFCIFSDDPEWVKKEFNIDNIIFAGNDILKDYEQMYLMSICKHNIIANSSFAWWGAWLNQNPNKIVLAPKMWTTTKTSEELDILPKEWITM